MASIDVYINPVTGQVEMQFLTCSAMLPDKPGLFFMSPSCGSGKSTVIAKLAAMATDGVLIVVATIEDANQMRDKVVAEGRRSSDIKVLHSQDFSIMETYRDNPMSFATSPVLIITSVRIQIDPSEPFMKYGSGWRRFVYIDELINFYPDPFEIPVELQDILTFIDNHRSHNGKPALETINLGGNTLYRHIYPTTELMDAAVKSAGKRVRHEILKGKGGLNEYKRQTIYTHIKANGFTPLRKRIIDLAALSTVIVFDGTADCIIPKTNPKLLPITGIRYSSDIEFSFFDFRMKRRNNEGWQESDLQTMAREFIHLATTLSQKEKILIICWKTLKLDTKNPGNADTLELSTDTMLSFPEILRRVLIDAGGKSENIFITYRGSGRDRGSNEYRDCSTVIFLGEWKLPDEPITSQIADMFGIKGLKFHDYKLSLLVQTICRYRIRHHKGLPIKVYFSSDINYNMAYDTQEYFKANSDSSCKIGGIQKPFRTLSRPDKKQLYYLTRLYGLKIVGPQIRTAVESGKPYCFNVKLSDLYSLLPISKRKAADRYKTFKKFLAGLKIMMTITS